MNRQHRPTVRDVAQAAGVSPMTVSRVVGNKAGVKAANRAAVQQAMAQLGYEPDPAARSMRTGRTGRIGFIAPDITNVTNAIVAQAAERRLAREGYQLMMFITDFDLEMERAVLERARNKLVDGLLIALTNETAPHIPELGQIGLPIVFIDRECAVEADAVLSEHRPAMEQVVTQLVALGHRHIALLSPPDTIRPARERILAFRDATARLGIQEFAGDVYPVDQSIESGYRTTFHIMAQAHRPTALIAGSNQLMLGAYKALRELHISIPADLSFVGTDDPFTASILSPPVSVIWRDMNEIGTLAAELVLARLAGASEASPKSAVVQSRVEVRSSIGPAAGNRSSTLAD